MKEKTKKGYVEGGAASDDSDDGDEDAADAAPGGADARNPALEKAILAEPYDKTGWMVLADWLQDQGDPRGELIALQTANKAKPAAALLDKYKDYFLGPLAEHTKSYDGSDKDAFTWRYGYIFGVRLSHNHYANEAWKGSLKDVLTTLLDHPSGRFITEMTLLDNNEPADDDLQDLIDVLAKRAPKSIRKLVFGEEPDQISWYNIGDLGKLWKAVPNLRTLLIEAGSFSLGKIDLPELRRAVFKTGGLSADDGKAIATAKWPNLEHLEIWYGDDNYGGDCSIKQVQPLLDRTDLTNLQYLGLKNAQFTDDICRALPKAKILAGISRLDLSDGIMTDEGAAALAAHKDAFAHLDEIDVSENYLSSAGTKLLKGLCKKVTGLGDQKDDDDPEYRSVSVGE
ncbi:MAG: TIGR02996 domain-containing protein [Proteobacteria bacterium]|nr:TIGR02996 domain-containing protein [Pseudomonadota bacterium]